MGHEESFSDDVKELESALASLTLRSSRIDRESIMFRAGWESAMQAARNTRRNGRFTWCWPAATAVMTVATIGLAIVLCFRGLPESTQGPVEKPRVAELSQSERVPSETTEKPSRVEGHDEDSAASLSRWALPEAPVPRKNLTNRAGSNYLRLRAAVVELGMDDLLTPPVSPGPVQKNSIDAEPLRFSDFQRYLNQEDTL